MRAPDTSAEPPSDRHSSSLIAAESDAAAVGQAPAAGFIRNTLQNPSETAATRAMPDARPIATDAWFRSSTIAAPVSSGAVDSDCASADEDSPYVPPLNWLV
jgi:hypothetical protein